MDIDHGKCSHEYPPKIKKHIYLQLTNQVFQLSYLFKNAFNLRSPQEHISYIFFSFGFYLVLFIFFIFICFKNIVNSNAQLNFILEFLNSAFLLVYFIIIFFKQYYCCCKVLLDNNGNGAIEVNVIIIVIIIIIIIIIRILKLGCCILNVSYNDAALMH